MMRVQDLGRWNAHQGRMRVCMRVTCEMRIKVGCASTGRILVYLSAVCGMRIYGTHPNPSGEAVQVLRSLLELRISAFGQGLIFHQFEALGDALIVGLQHLQHDDLPG